MAKDIWGGIQMTMGMFIHQTAKKLSQNYALKFIAKIRFKT